MCLTNRCMMLVILLNLTLRLALLLITDESGQLKCSVLANAMRYSNSAALK